MPLARTLFNLEITARAAARVRAARRPSPDRPTDIFLAVADHFEPQVGQPDADTARRRLDDWLTRYPQIAARHRDADGRAPAHTFYYPWDEYVESEMRGLSALCADGWGEIELHLHHRDDTEATLRVKLRAALAEYRRWGALTQWPDGRTAFGFVHGNWALDNSRHENGRNYCGVNSELTVLGEEGCYADFTFPAWGHFAQPRQVNQIYYATDDPERPKSYERGRAAQVGQPDQSGLLLAPGPLVPFWDRAGRRPRPAMDDGDLAASRRYAPDRLDRWVRAGIQVAGCPNRVFVKLHCHGAEDRNRRALLDADLDALFADAEARYNDGRRFRLHYVTTREMFNVIRATEAERPGPITEMRDWLLPAPANRAAKRA